MHAGVNNGHTTVMQYEVLWLTDVCCVPPPAVMVAANIPPYAVGGALLIVGALMVANVAKIPWDRIGQVQ